jgi:hypothetical protein
MKRWLAFLAFALTACSPAPAPTAAPASSAGQKPLQTKEQMAELGRQHKSAAELFQALREQAKGGQRLTPANIPDWTGLYTRHRIPGYPFDLDQPAGGLPTAKLTPEYQARLMKRIDDRKKGIEWDPISTCSPPGFPRWLTEPFLREFIVTPDQTLLINEMMNDVRRIYTDGRDHTPEEDRYPLYNGDSIGFWDGQKLVIHTNQLKAGIYQRGQPDYSDQVETVEIWYKVDDNAIGADVWVYDPPVLQEPWFARQVYEKLSNEDKSIRIRYWHCGENENNAVVQTTQGGTQFKDFTFTDKDDKGGQR